MSGSRAKQLRRLAAALAPDDQKARSALYRRLKRAWKREREGFDLARMSRRRTA